MLSRTVFYGASGTAVVILLNKLTAKKPIAHCSSNNEKNSAFVFIKPHANTTATQNLVKATFEKKGIKVLSEGELTAEQIDKVKYDCTILN